MSEESGARARERLAAQVADGTLELPVLPEVASQVMAATSREEVNAKELTDLLRRDPALAGHLLRMANSPLYLPKTPIVSLQQAVSRLGMKTIRQIALLISCQTRAFSVRGHEARVKALFRHSLACALVAQELARLRRLNVEDAFLCGLLHDVGRPVLLQALVDLEKETGKVDDGAIDPMLGSLHEAAGEAMIRGWKLPARMASTVRFHHHPDESPDQGGAALINLADDLAHFLCGPREVNEETVRAHPMLPRLNIYPDELDKLLARKTELIAAIDAIG